jgi:HSP20 family protein
MTIMPPRNPYVWMWSQACETLDRADRLHRQFFHPGAAQQKSPSWEPPVDLYETAEEIGILVALPGVEPANVQVVIEDGMLIVTGVRAMPAADRTSVIRRLEIPHGRFERRIELASGRYELRRRDLVNGCLLLTLRKL